MGLESELMGLLSTCLVVSGFTLWILSRIAARGGARIIYNLGWYTDVLSEGQSFSSYDQQIVARVGFLPILEEKGTLLHVASRAATRATCAWPRARAARPALPRGGRGRELHDHRRDAEVQHRRRLELAYGVGQLDRFGVVGTTQFFQSRLQFQF